MMSPPLFFLFKKKMDTHTILLNSTLRTWVLVEDCLRIYTRNPWEIYQIFIYQKNWTNATWNEKGNLQITATGLYVYGFAKYDIYAKGIFEILNFWI